MSQGISELANQIEPLRGEYARAKARPYGLMVHTCGRTIVSQAISAGVAPDEYVVNYYMHAKFAPHYVGAWDGALHQLADESQVMYHGGISKEERASYIDGTWKETVSATVPFWNNRWATKTIAWSKKHPTSPISLYPSRDPNEDYVGIELIPIVGGCGATPAFPGSLFTMEQHRLVTGLMNDTILRWHMPFGPGQLVGHEDTNPLERSDVYGGWDPGAIRPCKYFDWNWVTPIGG